MNNQPKIHKLNNMRGLVNRLRDDLRNTPNGGCDFVLLYAYNGTGKTRLSMEFKEAGKRKKGIGGDTLYFNAYTEDLFYWDNDLANDRERVLRINKDSHFFDGLQALEMESRIRPLLQRYVDFDFVIDYEQWTINFIREVQENNEAKTIENIKVSRGEENIFIWCFFLAIAELTIDGQESYAWVKYLYIDDPISSLDDNNAIAVASDLAKLLKREDNRIKTVISSHHGLFFNVMFHELRKAKTYFLHHCNDTHQYTLRATHDTPFFHHVAVLSELQQAAKSGKLYTHHFNMLRSILEKTASFLGFNDFSKCIDDFDDKELYARALNLLSHGNYSIFEPSEMVQDNKTLFNNILNAFLKRYPFALPEMNI